MACSTCSPARNVRSITAPVLTFFSLVRTKAPPFPGFTCWNSTTANKPSVRLRVIPLRRSLVETAIRRYFSSDRDFFRELCEGSAAVCGYNQGVLNADPTGVGHIDTGLHGDHGAGGED